jgi:hypothetical protein
VQREHVCICLEDLDEADSWNRSAFSSFPDSMIFETGSQIHSFKLAALGMEDTTSAFIFGYAYFMQQRDPTSKRGYLQVDEFTHRSSL